MEKKTKKKEKEKGEKRRGKGEKKRGEEEKRRKKKNKNRESSARDAPLPPDAFPSTKLGNNMTPIEGRLGKNTTPTCKKKQQRRPQIFRRIPNKDDQASTIHLTQIPVTHQRKRSIQSISPTAMKPLFIRKSKPSETSANAPNSPSISIKGVRTFSRKSEV